MGALLAIILLSWLVLDVLTLYSFCAYAYSTVCYRPHARPACIMPSLKPLPWHSAKHWPLPTCPYTISGKSRFCLPQRRLLCSTASPPGSIRGVPVLPKAGRRCKTGKPATAAPASTRPTHCTCTCSMPISQGLFPCFACYPSLPPVCPVLQVLQQSGYAWKSDTLCSPMQCSGMT